MTPSKCEIGEAMEFYGGSFVRALGTALINADPDNTRRIKEAFPEYWAKYSDLAKPSDEALMAEHREKPEIPYSEPVFGEKEEGGV